MKLTKIFESAHFTVEVTLQSKSVEAHSFLSDRKYEVEHALSATAKDIGSIEEGYFENHNRVRNPDGAPLTDPRGEV